MSIENIIFYHYPCNDGELAKTIWQLKYPKSKFVKWNHVEKHLAIDYINNIIEPRQIVFLDICPTLDILPIKHKYIILDHHKNAVETLNLSLNGPHQYDIVVIYDILKSGCMLTWDYCFPTKVYPLVVKHIGNKDIWDFSDIDTEPYCLGYNDIINITNNNNMINSTIKVLLNSDTIPLHNMMIEIGNKMIKENQLNAGIYFCNIKYNKEIIDNIEYDIIDIECSDTNIYKYLIEYAQKTYNSDVLRILHTKQPTINTYSLRSLKEHINVDTIARKYGGNGHMKAAGYSITIDSHMYL